MFDRLDMDCSRVQFKCHRTEQNLLCKMISHNSNYYICLGGGRQRESVCTLLPRLCCERLSEGELSYGHKCLDGQC